MAKMIAVSIALTPELVNALARLEDRDGIGRSKAVRRALEPYLQEMGVLDREGPKGKSARKR